MLEFLIEVVGEFILQIVLEVLVELGFQSFVEASRRPPSPWVSALGYTLLGGAVGAFSLMPFPSHLVASEGLRLANLIFTPAAVGLLMCGMGAWRARRGEPILRIDRFACGYLFALALAFVRFLFAQ